MRNIFTIAVVINTIIFLGLSLVHFYWAVGGRLWYNDVLPSNTSGSNRLSPGTTATVVVALGLLLLAAVTASPLVSANSLRKPSAYRYAMLFVAVLFFARAIGDFKFVGFFKTITNTRFAVNDTNYFSPLCVLVGVLSLTIFLFSKQK